MVSGAGQGEMDLDTIEGGQASAAITVGVVP